MTDADAAAGLEALATLLEAGLPVSRALGTLADVTPPAWRPVVTGMAREVRTGTSVPAALRAFAPSLPAAVLGAIEAADAGVGLAAAMRQAARLARARADARAALKAAMLYPAVLLATGAVALAGLIGFVLPRFAESLADAGQALPPAARLLLAVGGWGRSSAPLIAALLAIGVASARTAMAEPRRRRQFHAWLLALPMVGSWRLSHGSAHGCAALSALVAAGAPLPVALQHAGLATGDGELRSRFEEVVLRVRHGEAVWRAAADVGAVTPASAGLLRVGDETGRLADLAARAADLEFANAASRLKAATQLLEPALILTMGTGVALVAAVLLQAVYAVRPST
jgi:general secretion pathway protein F